MQEAKYHLAVTQLKKQLILTALEEAKGNYTEAARILGVHANYLHRLVRNLELADFDSFLPDSSRRGGTGRLRWPDGQTRPRREINGRSIKEA